MEGEGRVKGEGTVKGIGFIWPFTLQLLLPHTPAGHLVGVVQLLCGRPLYLDTLDMHHMIQSHPELFIELCAIGLVSCPCIVCMCVCVCVGGGRGGEVGSEGWL